MHRPGWILGLSLTLFASVGCRERVSRYCPSRGMTTERHQRHR